jgi:hypothetical protein
VNLIIKPQKSFQKNLIAHTFPCRLAATPTGNGFFNLQKGCCHMFHIKKTIVLIEEKYQEKIFSRTLYGGVRRV